ncbi:MAG: phosphatidylglycerol lysyltransferase domain-containing protein, partial [Ruminococcus callidus]
LYRTADFVALSGKKYHKKRNHIAQFARYAPVFSEMTPDDFAECIAFAAESYNAKDGYTDASSVAEQYAIHTFFENFSALELKGGVLRVDGELAAFSIGEPICSNTFGVQSKGGHRFHGAYPAMAQAFAAHFAMDYTYLNRERSGHSGLRKSSCPTIRNCSWKNGRRPAIPGKSCCKPRKAHTSFVWCCPGTNLFYQIQKGSSL